ncbi:MAG: hypothetical protein KJ795_02200 [Gammaproteobacteria bacterium]|nr:hypothetical protein [Gammaproteobacteria bacterium]MBU1426615.1 hypothetical protein [Gammaproteobacteria bacterium]MBU1775997.1 hypothetical protein [Gammaproteobacteria bacterium]MBU1967578.1 hypothetical protein [Gammaproteobacteria bacterium]
MRTYQCPNCMSSFTEADNLWDVAINSDQCPKCSVPLSDFPGTKPENIKSTTNLQPQNGALLNIVLFIIWAISAFISSAIAILSVSSIVISIVTLASIVSLISAFILAFNQKTVTAFVVAFVSAPATIGILMAYIYVVVRL